MKIKEEADDLQEKEEQERQAKKDAK